MREARRPALLGLAMGATLTWAVAEEPRGSAARGDQVEDLLGSLQEAAERPKSRQEMEDEASLIPTPVRSAWRALTNLLPDTRKPPRIPPLPKGIESPMVIVLDLDVLCSIEFVNGRWVTLRRPGMENFLRQCASGNTEVVVFGSDLSPMMGWTLLQKLDPGNLVTYKFFDDFRKDTPSLGRPGTHVLIMTTDPNSWLGADLNVVEVPKWDGRRDDPTLKTCLDFVQVAQYGVEVSGDVRFSSSRAETVESLLTTDWKKMLRLMGGN